MKHTLMLSIIASTAIMAGGKILPKEELVLKEPVKVETTVADKKMDWGDIYGQSRTFFLDRTYSGLVNNNRSSMVTGGYIGYKTPTYDGLHAAIALYGLYGFDIHDQHADIIGSSMYDPALYGRDFENYAFIGHAYINYVYAKTTLKAGRMRLDTPMIAADDARELPNLFEAAVVTNTDIANTTLGAMHVFRETVGTFGNIYGGTELGMTSGYGRGMREALSGDFVNMGTLALGGTENETAGVSALSAIYTGFKNIKLQAWDYIAWDIMNTLYLEGDYTIGVDKKTKVKLSMQYINQTDMGDSLAGSMDTNYVAGKVTGIYDKLSAYVALSTTGKSDGALGGGVLTPWGGMPAFTQGMVTRHQFFADTTAWKVAGAYHLSEYGVKASAYYTYFDIGAQNSYDNGTAWTASESGFDVQYDVAAVKGLNLRFRANYPRDFKSGLDWDEYRLIANYNF